MPAPTSRAARRCCAPGSVLTSREIGVLAAIGVAPIDVYRRPRVAIFSTGDEIVAPGTPLPLGADLRFQRGDHRRGRGGTGRRAGAARRRCRRRSRARDCGSDDALGYDLVVLSGGTSKGAGDLSYRVVEPARRPRHRRARRRAQARQADLPRCHGRQACRHPAGISDVGDFHVPRIRRTGAARATRACAATGSRSCPRRCRCASIRERGRTEYLLVGLVQRRRRIRRVSDGQGFGFGHRVQRRRRLHHDRSAHRDRRCRRVGFRPVARPAPRAGGPRHHRQPLRRSRRDRRRAVATRRANQGPARRQHGRPRRGATRRMRHRRHPSDGREDRPVQPAPADGRVDARARLRADAGDRLSSRRCTFPAQGCRGRTWRRTRRSGVLDGQSQHRQRHANPGRPAARRASAGGLRRADEIAQCRRCSGEPGARRLGRGDRHGRACLSPRASFRCRRSNTTSSFPGRAPRVAPSKRSATC